MFYTDPLRGNVLSTQTRAVATHLVLERPSQCGLAGLCLTPLFPPPPPTTESHTGWVLTSSSATQRPPLPKRAPNGARVGGMLTAGGMWWAVTSHGLPAYVRTSNSQAVTTASPGTAGGWKRGSQSHRKALARFLPVTCTMPTCCPPCSCPGCGEAHRKHLVPRRALALAG